MFVYAVDLFHGRVSPRQRPLNVTAGSMLNYTEDTIQHTVYTFPSAKMEFTWRETHARLVSLHDATSTTPNVHSKHRIASHITALSGHEESPSPRRHDAGSHHPTLKDDQ